ncbi:MULTISPECIES: hypothetical protein [Pontibacillus]|uniref:Uncharacterized protein n=1 Tax=Pontibacillus chungwhensis TaxID=265426 RepID=A0ABY8V034_9BACI|nr:MULTISPECIES: hypothetical protein [Pontibacillus]MCD5324404.1 hypothetical protein [Pontibacillus sp. HN14]WIF99300.1 hypothetical protein QNI29_06470 [Pontibacillus chungwhensis]
MKKDGVIYILDKQIDITKRLEWALDNVEEREKFKKSLVNIEDEIDDLSSAMGNVRYIGKHVDIPIGFFDFYFRESDPVYKALDELQDHELSDQTLKELKGYYKKHSDLTAQVKLEEFENMSFDEYMEKLEEVNRYMNKYEDWRTTRGDKGEG